MTNEWSQEDQERQALIVQGLEASPLFKAECRDVLLDHLMGKINLFKQEPFLSADEKRALGLNTRIKFSKAFIDCLTEAGVREPDSKHALSVIRLKASGKASRARDLRGLRRAGFKKVEILDCGDERDCKWVGKKKNRTHAIDTDIESLIRENCDAEYCRCTLIAPD